MESVYDAWLDHGPDCKIIEVRNKHKGGSDRAQCLLHHNVQLGSEGKRFFSRLESMQKANKVDDLEFDAIDEYMYQARV